MIEGLILGTAAFAVIIWVGVWVWVATGTKGQGHPGLATFALVMALAPAWGLVVGMVVFR